LTRAPVRPTILEMAEEFEDSQDVPGDIDAREAARIRRRDRDADAEARALLRPGMGKVFKQIQDAQAKVAKEPPKRRGRRA
jgi:hypothetical protein